MRGAIGRWDATQRQPVTNTSQNAVCSANANPTSTANVTIAGWSVTVTSPGPGAVFVVQLEPDWSIATAGTIAIIELLVDGTAQTVIHVLNSSGTGRWPGSKKWRLTGLAAGSHTFTARTRNSAGSTSSIVNLTDSTMHVMQES